MSKSQDLDFYIPHWEELPDIDLYLDQVVTFIDKYLKNYIKIDSEDKEDKTATCVTKTMINNYVKQGILEAPIKKKYNKKHISYLFVICILKQVYSISEIDKLIKLAQKDYPVNEAYNTFCNALESSIKNIFAGKSYLNIKHLPESTYLLINVVQTFASKLYVEKKALNF